MKKFLLFLCLTALAYNANSQITYYWVGGNGPITFTGTSRWNTALNGSGTARTVADSTDILIFDGTNVGGATPKTGSVSATVTSTKIGQLKLINNANLILSRPTGGGTGTLTITGGAGEDFVVDANSSFTINSIVDSGAVSFLVQLGATGLVSGNVTITNTATNRMICQAAGALVFDGTSNCTVSTQPATSSYPFGSNTQGVEKGVVFLAGSKLTTTGKYSPMGGTSTYMAIDFKPGSNYYIRASNAASTGSWTANKVFGNVFIQNGATLTADGAVSKIENFTIDAGCSFITHTSGQTAVTGNLVVNGSLTGPVAASTNTLVMGGTTPQSITGTGTISIPAFVVADNSNVSLGVNIVTTGVTTTNIVGKLDFGTSIISGTSPFISRVAGTAGAITGNTTAGSTIITGITGTLSGNTALTISGAGIPTNTNVLGFSTGNSTISMSQAATATATGVALTFASNAATLSTSHPNGFDSLTGCVTVTGAKSFASGTNYIVNAATAHPIGISSTATTAMTIGNIALNAPATTNYNTRVNGAITLNTGKFTIRPTDTVRVFSGNDILGFPFNSSKYIITANNGVSVGVLRIDTFNTAKAFPVGTATDYLPVKLTPSDYANFCVSVYQGVTNDGTLAGTAFSALQKTSVVDAAWVINRTKGTGNCDVNLYWVNGLEGSDFANYTNSQIGISRYDGAAWTVANALSADNTANFANDTTSSFGTFGVGKIGAILPVKLSGINVAAKDNIVTLSWNTINEINVEKYTIERSVDGRNFATVGNVNATNGSKEKTYYYNDATAVKGNNYYRIVVIDKDGKTSYSKIVAINLSINQRISLSPNPANNEVVVSGIEKGVTVQIIDITGKMILQEIANSNTQIINISQFTKGFYAIKTILQNGEVNTQPFIKQ